MSSIQQRFACGKKRYVGFLTAGDGGYTHSLQSMLALIRGGVDILEIGVPFSDPIADGTVIQHASQRAIHAGMTLDKVFELVAAVRQYSDIPLVLFSYYHSVFTRGAAFYREARTAGANGLLVVDLPPEECGTHLAHCKQQGIDPIFLISPSTPVARLHLINQYASGMLYYVCRNGTTGIKDSLPDDFADKMRLIRRHTNLPIVTGFGIANQQMAASALQHADGFVVGSQFVNAAHHIKDYNQLTQLAIAIDPRK